MVLADLSTERYDVRVVRRQFQMTSDDWHATVTRRSDGKELVHMCAWLWLLKLELRPRRLDRWFATADRYEAEGQRVEEWSVR